MYLFSPFTEGTTPWSLFWWTRMAEIFFPTTEWCGFKPHSHTMHGYYVSDEIFIFSAAINSGYSGSLQPLAAVRVFRLRWAHSPGLALTPWGSPIGLPGGEVSGFTSGPMLAIRLCWGRCRWPSNKPTCHFAAGPQNPQVHICTFSRSWV